MNRGARPGRAVGALTTAVLLAGCTAAADGAGPPAPSVAPLPPPSAADRAAAGLDPCPAGADDAAPVAGGLPDVTLPCLGDGPPVRLAALRGTPTVVNVWAQWCEPCRAEVPVLQALHEQAPGGVRVLGVDHQDDPTFAVRFLAELGAGYPSVYDGDGEADLTRGPGLPQTLLVDADGRVVHTAVGELDRAELAGLLDTHLGIRW